jgi:hypothetical protein
MAIMKDGQVLVSKVIDELDQKIDRQIPVNCKVDRIIY